MTGTADSARCAHQDERGQCGAYHQHDSQYCFRHDPAKEAERQAAWRKGGVNSNSRKKRVPIAVEPPQSAQNVVATLSTAMAAVLRGQLEPRNSYRCCAPSRDRIITICAL